VYSLMRSVRESERLVWDTISHVTPSMPSRTMLLTLQISIFSSLQLVSFRRYFAFASLTPGCSQ